MVKKGITRVNFELTLEPYESVLDVSILHYSPEVKGIVFISNKHGIYVLCHELPNNLRLRNLGNLRKLGNIKKISNLHRIIA